MPRWLSTTDGAGAEDRVPSARRGRRRAAAVVPRMRRHSDDTAEILRIMRGNPMPVVLLRRRRSPSTVRAELVASAAPAEALRVVRRGAR